MQTQLEKSPQIVAGDRDIGYERDAIMRRSDQDDSCISNNGSSRINMVLTNREIRDGFQPSARGRICGRIRDPTDGGQLMRP